ncbi:MAG: thiamine pyrophosphate-binding protein [Chloroflexota bacterium]
MNSRTSMTCARFIAETLHGYGVSHVFYIDAILRHTLVELERLGVQRIVTHSEKAAAYMADGYARISGRPGVCMAQSVGAANMAAGLQDAYLGCSPVIALTGCKPPLFQHRNAYQEIVHGPLYQPVTKYNVNVVAAGQLPFYLRQAFREVTSGKPRPAHLDLLGARAEVLEQAAIDSQPVVEESYTRYPSARPAPDPEQVRLAAQALARASRPVIVAGGGVRISGAGPEIVRLAEKLSVPVATSVNGKGSIPENHPLCAGVVGSYSRWCANRIVAEADLVIYVGSHTGDQVTYDWQIPTPGTPVVQIDIDPSELGKSYPNTVGVLGDTRVALEHLADCLDGQGSHARWVARAQAWVREWEAEYEPLLTSAAIPIRPERLCQELSDVLPPEAILVSDTGYSAIWTATMIRLTDPRQTFIRAAGSLGWAFPAALGARCAAPQRPVICFTGDGGFLYHMGELETASRYGITTVTIVNNNSGLGQCIPGVHAAYGDRSGDKESLYRFRQTNYARIAKEMGCVGIRVEAPQEIAPAVRRALASSRPVVIDVVTDLNAEAPTPWRPAR